MTHSFSSTNNSRNVKKLAPSPLITTSISSRGTPLNKPTSARCNPNNSSGFNPLKTSGSWSDKICNSPSPSPGLQGASRKESPCLSSENKSCFSGETMWSHRLKCQSSNASDSHRSVQTYESPGSSPGEWPSTNAISSSPVSGSAKGKKSEGDAKSATKQGRISMANVMKVTHSPGWQVEETVPHPINSSLSSTMQDKTAQQQFKAELSNGFTSDKPERQRKNRQRKTKSFGNGSASGSINFSQSPNSSPVPWQQRDRKQNSKSKSSGKGPSSHLTLENFITPQKLNGKKNIIKSDKKDILLENRFVEHIAANPTSPPKKVRPSPIKKLNFAKNESSIEYNLGDKEGLNPGAAGDADSVLSQDVEKQEYVRTKEGVQKGNASELRQHSLQNSLVFSMKKYFKDEQKETGDIFEEENEDEDEYPDLTEKDEVQQFWSDSFALSSDLMTPRCAFFFPFYNVFIKEKKKKP